MPHVTTESSSSETGHLAPESSSSGSSTSFCVSTDGFAALEGTALDKVARWATASQLLSRYGSALALAAAFLIPIKLTLGYFALFPLIVLWLLGGDLKVLKQPIVYRLLLVAAIAAVSGVFGIAPERSLTGALRFGFTLCAVPAVFSVMRAPERLAIAAILGQSIAALATLLELGLGVALPRYFVGPVTESGQLAIIIPILVGLLVARPAWINRKTFALLTGTLLVLATALLLNAKRGPFFGCVAGLGLLFLLSYPRALLPFGLASLLALFSFPQLHQRMLHSLEHFTIAGGRSEMWSIGLELLSRYPLGIGFDNSAFLRKFSLEVPPEHTHFHNNLINLAVETGWFGLFVFVWWLGALLFAAWNLYRNQSAERSSRFLALGYLAAIFSWQVAGLFEYNIGDSEVFVVMLLQLGALLALVHREKRSNPTNYQQ